jgi:hypothetical protein
MTKKLFFIFILFLIPNFCFAIDLTKGLQEAPENWKERTKFIEGKGSLRTASIEQYPIPFFMLAAGGSTIFTFDTEKETYQAGEKVNFHIEAKNSGFIKKAFLNFKERKIHYWWSAGNFFVEIYHLSDEVKDGEFLVASGKVFKDDAISVFQEQSREFNFDWLIPESTKGGNYEIRVYPLSKDIFFDGSPESYRVLMKTRIRINGKDKEELVAWDLAEMKLDDAPVRLKEKVVYLEAGNKYNLSIPLINQGNEREQILVSKRILRLSPEYGQAKNEEIQRVTLEPEEKKLINFEISENNIGKLFYHLNKQETTSRIILRIILIIPLGAKNRKA